MYTVNIHTLYIYIYIYTVYIHIHTTIKREREGKKKKRVWMCYVLRGQVKGNWHDQDPRLRLFADKVKAGQLLFT